MSLTKLYDVHGLSSSFMNSHTALDLKGVLLESLGFLQLRHTVEYGAYESLLKPFSVKFGTYLQNNAKDMMKNKEHAI